MAYGGGRGNTAQVLTGPTGAEPRFEMALLLTNKTPVGHLSRPGALRGRISSASGCFDMAGNRASAVDRVEVPPPQSGRRARRCRGSLPERDSRSICVETDTGEYQQTLNRCAQGFWLDGESKSCRAS
jgi:hypothetical protein